MKNKPDAQYDREQVVNDIDNIIRKVVEHFKYEEKVLIKLGYEDIYNHKKIHIKLIEKAEKIKEDFKMEKINAKETFNLFFEEVIVGHLLEQDIKYFSDVKNIKQNRRVK